MSRLIDADALCRLARNSKYGVVDCNDIRRMPTVDAVKVVHGEWQAMLLDGQYWTITCSNCHLVGNAGRQLFCPNCGAKMDGKEKKNE